MRRLILPLLFFLAAAATMAVEMAPTFLYGQDGLPSACLAGSTGNFERVNGDCGAASERALLATFSSPTVTVQTALDYRKPGLARPDCLRVSFDGRRNFTNAYTLPLKAPGNTFRAAYVMIHTGQREIFTISGEVDLANPSTPKLTLQLTVTAERQCTFGKRTYPVTVIDGNANLLLGDAPAVAAETYTPGDLLLVGHTAQGACGQPVYVDGHWYTVEISPDAATIRAMPVDLGTGQVMVDQPRWSGLFAGSHGAFQVYGGRKAVPLPPDSYQVVALYLWEPGETLHWAAPVLRNAERTVTVTAGQTAGLPVYAEARGKIIAKVAKDGAVTFSLALTDAKGQAVEAPPMLVGEELHFAVLDATGQRVTTGSFKVEEERILVYSKEYG